MWSSFSIFLVTANGLGYAFGILKLLIFNSSQILFNDTIFNISTLSKLRIAFVVVSWFMLLSVH